MADKIFLMTNGPRSVLAEVIENPLAQDQARVDLRRHPQYRPIRNHIMDFLIKRSQTFRDMVPNMIRAACRSSHRRPWFLAPSAPPAIAVSR